MSGSPEATLLAGPGRVFPAPPPATVFWTPDTSELGTLPAPKLGANGLAVAFSFPSEAASAGRAPNAREVGASAAVCDAAGAPAGLLLALSWPGWHSLASISPSAAVLPAAAAAPKLKGWLVPKESLPGGALTSAPALPASADILLSLLAAPKAGAAAPKLKPLLGGAPSASASSPPLPLFFTGPSSVCRVCNLSCAPPTQPTANTQDTPGDVYCTACLSRWPSRR